APVHAHALAVATDAPHAESPSETPVAPPPVSPEETEPILLTAPMVGLFHHLSQPVRYGGLITPGEVVGSIESMKLMTDVPAQQGGRVVEVLVEDGGPVEYGQALFRLDAA
nr:biotin/lipoyl-binding protein [Armatimonadota bacterium]